MFKLSDNLKFIVINQDYIKALHDICTEVYYKPLNYENKPYLGILIQTTNERKYVIPLSSAKEKHRAWKDVDKERYLIYELAKIEKLTSTDIWKTIPDESDYVKHILSAIDIKKMIPVKDGLYHVINLNPCATDTEDVKKYKDLLNKEYSFCLKCMDDIMRKADKIYENQKQTGKVTKYACDYTLLESVCDTYSIT